MSWISVTIISQLQNSFLGPILHLVCFAISYLILICIIVALFFYVFLVNPNFVRKSTVIMFFTWTIGLFSFLKLFLAELRPYMFSRINKYQNVGPWDCEADFGMPSAHMILVVSMYYLYKVLFFCQDYQLKLTCEDIRPEAE